MNKKILVVDDEKNIRALLEDRLTQMGYEVETASNGEEALRVFPALKPAIVLTDLIMPKLDGMGLLKQIKMQNPGTGVIMMTAHGTIDKAVEAMKNGAWGFLLKPVDKSHMEIIMRECLDSIKIRKEHDELARLNEWWTPSGYWRERENWFLK